MADVEVLLEVGPKRSFVSALWFPGWCAHARTPEAALERFAEIRSRYVAVAKAARRTLPSATSLVVVERQVGNATTDFGAPGQISDLEREVDEAQLKKLRALHGAARDYFESIAAAAPEELRKGPRGGGRDTSKMLAHVVEVEAAYASRARRGTWPEAYYLRRSAYHFTDHAWEIEDRSSAS